MREWEIGAVENIHGALPYIRFAPILALVGVGLNRIGKEQGKAVMDAWGAWMGKVGDGLVDVGSPFGGGASVSDDGRKEPRQT